MANYLPTMNWSDPDLKETMSLFNQKRTLYIEDEKIMDKTKQARKIYHSIGDQGLRCLNASGFTEQQKRSTESLWNFFKSQLRVNINFRIHRLPLLQYWQKANKSLDDFITRARTLTQKSNFTDQEFSIRYDAFHNKLYNKPKGYSIANVLIEGRKYEALTAGNKQLNQLGTPKAEKMYNINQNRKCRNCNTNHKPRQCPAYNDEYSACESKRHRARWCQKTLRIPGDKANIIVNPITIGIIIREELSTGDQEAKKTSIVSTSGMMKKTTYSTSTL